MTQGEFYRPSLIGLINRRRLLMFFKIFNLTFGKSNLDNKLSRGLPERAVAV